MYRSSKWFRMTAEEYRAEIEAGKIPHIAWDDDGKTKFDYFVLVPRGELHESGWAAMYVVAFCFAASKDGAYPKGVFESYSDVIHLDGIGGYGKWDNGSYKPLSAHGWTLDMLPSGLVRVFPNASYELTGAGLSSFEVWAVTKRE